MRIFYSLIILLFLAKATYGQLTVGNTFPNVNTAQMVGTTTKSWSLYNNEASIVVLDYFGTWCVPCIKALPQLKDYQSKFGKDIAIALISKESADRLEKFVSNQKDLTFPVLVDIGETFHNIAQPPSYPFTVILSKSYKVLAITSTSDIDEGKIANWIAQSKSEAKTTVVVETIPTPEPIKTIAVPKVLDNKILQLSQNFLLAIKSNEDANEFKKELAALNSDSLASHLKSNEERIAFWLNMYNAFTNETLKKDPEQYKDRKTFFKKKFITIAGKAMSLDNIEHGILRRSKHKLSMGYFNTWFKSDFEKQNRVEKLDWRIHFALNCGAKSCPPIAFYTANNLNNELDAATKNYLTSEVELDEKSNLVKVPVLFSWFRKDFGGKRQIIPILQKNNILAVGKKPKIKFKKYDWNLLVENYSK